MKYVFLDTNVFLQFKDFEQILWGKLIGDNDFTIVVSDVVSREIDKHKDSARGKVQKRAKKVSRKLASVFLEGEKLRVSMEFCSSHPACLSDVQKAMFDVSSQDDKILMCILASDYPDEDIVLVSYDNGILIKAKACGLNILHMPEGYLLKEELSEEEKELALYKKELADLKNRMPKPILALNNEKAVLKIQFQPFTPIEDVVKAHIEEMKQKYPHVNMPVTSAKGNLSGITLGNYGLFDATSMSYYNRYLDAFYDKEEKHCYFGLKQDELERQMQKLSFALHNDGTDETGNVDVFISFPDEVMLYTDESKKYIDIEIPSTPAPYRPFSVSFMNEAFRSDNQKKYDRFAIWDFCRPIEQHQLHFKVSAVNHSVGMLLSDGNAYYINKSSCGNFDVKYRIVDSKLIEPIEGKIHVEVEQVGAKINVCYS